MSATGISLTAVRELARRDGMNKPAKFPMQKPGKIKPSTLISNLCKRSIKND